MEVDNESSTDSENANGPHWRRPSFQPFCVVDDSNDSSSDEWSGDWSTGYNLVPSSFADDEED